MSRTQIAFDLYLFGVLGLVLLAAPWTPLWEAACTPLLPAGASALVRSGWFRGAVSGLGAIDLAVAAQHAHALWGALKPRGRTVESK